ncbi:GntR family transcriptional regulator [Zavarzinella formosa]|uniref:GntR family transcriptional regulator n=1 Tax=Zavarzinella formosa TaxID=360055 RepID=UPI0002D6DFC1|nr:GntR family transcriptional regulator [Zavarzinella formosa]
MAKTTLNRTCLAEQIRDVVADRIGRGDYPPGYRLVELCLAKEFGTSQAPVREAIRMLGGLGLVDSVPRKGARVREMTDREQREMNQVRAALEDMACVLAARHFQTNAEAGEELRRLNAIVTRAAKKGDFETLAVSNNDFHRLIVNASGNQTLIELWESTALRPRGLVSQIRKGFDPLIVVEHHIGIIESLLAGRGDEAGRRMRDHGLHFARLHEEPVQKSPA